MAGRLNPEAAHYFPLQCYVPIVYPNFRPFLPPPPPQTLPAAAYSAAPYTYSPEPVPAPPPPYTVVQKVSSTQPRENFFCRPTTEGKLVGLRLGFPLPGSGGRHRPCNWGKGRKRSEGEFARKYERERKKGFENHNGNEYWKREGSCGSSIKVSLKKIGHHEVLPLRRSEEKTSIMIKNVPNKYTRKSLMKLLDKHCSLENERAKQLPDEQQQHSVSAFDFIYLPMDFRQGKEALVSHFDKSVFFCKSDEFLPVCFSPPRDGASGEDQAVMITIIGKRLTPCANRGVSLSPDASKTVQES
ncbi:hypothetical protein RJ639_016199 [Escallonia herrerae]|uniref:Uncharacterized protein n=1 Tax=Escallonia herrerae TaxID=1293975 RepID=A0AA88VF98_9ASTE|nr:hypothetical protein RJ639_016199 [Escallonia herrerae]